MLFLPKGTPNPKGDAHTSCCPLQCLASHYSHSDRLCCRWKRRVGLVPGVQGRRAHCEQEEAQQKLNETLLLWTEATKQALMAPAFFSPLNSTSQMGHLITSPSSAQPFWPPFCLLFLPAASRPTVPHLAKEKAAKPRGSVRRELCLLRRGRTNSRRSPAWPGGSCGNQAVNTLGRRFLPAPRRLRMQSSVRML